MNEPQLEPEINLSEAGKLRRKQILGELKTELVSRHLLRRRRQTLTGVAVLFVLFGGLVWSNMPKEIDKDDKQRLAQKSPKNEKAETAASSSERAPATSQFRPQVVTNRSELAKTLVATNVSYDRPRIEFNSIETEELSQLLEEQGGKFVVGRIGGMLRVVPLGNDLPGKSN